MPTMAWTSVLLQLHGLSLVVTFPQVPPRNRVPVPTQLPPSLAAAPVLWRGTTACPERRPDQRRGVLGGAAQLLRGV